MLLQHVDGGPDGRVVWHVVVAGEARSIQAGTHPAPDVTFSQDYATAVAVARGDLSAQEAFMTGRITLSGTAGALILAAPALAAVGDAQARAGFEFEPDAAGVLEALLPRYVESRLFSALLDAAASEHASRQRAMKSATDNAEDMILRLTRKMNQVRQDAITTEISEIISGAEALNDDQDDEGDTAHHLAAQHLSFEHVAHEHFNHQTHR